MPILEKDEPEVLDIVRLDIAPLDTLLVVKAEAFELVVDVA